MFRIIFKFAFTIFLLWSVGLVYFYSQIAPEPKNENALADAIIVLTGGNDRIAEGVRLLSQKRAEKLLISGVNKDSRLNELVEQQGISHEVGGVEDKIYLGRKAVDTVGNAEEAAEWVKDNYVKSIFLVTANYHMPRALVEFRRAMPEIEIVPHPVFPKSFKRDEWRKDKFTRDLIVVEYNKYIYALVRESFGKKSMD